MNIHDILFWGMFGLTVEIFFTAIRDLIIYKKFNLIGHTSLLMFPIYAFGLTYGFELITYLIKNDTLRYMSYPIWIWAIEIIVGIPAVWYGIKIWDYSYLPKKLHWRGIISFVHYPLWVGFGMIVEIIK